MENSKFYFLILVSVLRAVQAVPVLPLRVPDWVRTVRPENWEVFAGSAQRFPNFRTKQAGDDPRSGYAVGSESEKW